MAKITFVFGLLLVVLGVAGYVLTGSMHPTALIPCWFGIGLWVCAAAASRDNPGGKRTVDEASAWRMLWMHIAVTLGLLGFLFPGFMAVKDLVKAHVAQVPLPFPAAVHEQLIMALVCLVFVGLCVRSFIAARRARLG